MSHWEDLSAYQPENILILFEADRPIVVLHGELVTDGSAIVHLLAVRPGKAEEAADLLRFYESVAGNAGFAHLIGPHWGSARFYGGYILGREPYHPHWGVDATEAFIRAGWRISQPGVVLVRDLSSTIDNEPDPDGYTIVEVTPSPEFTARVFGFHAQQNGQKVAHCYARWYPYLSASTGGTIGQIGNVTTEPRHRSLGLARVMVERSFQRLRDLGAREALISTGLDNLPALRAYENTGFQRRHSINEWSKSIQG
jgi:GNAT superfamily N-acetyltransferase